MRTTKPHTITHKDGSTVTYQLMQCGAQEGRKACTRLLKCIGGAVSAGVEVKDKGQDAMLAAGFAGLTEHVSEDDMDYFCDLLSRHTMVNNQLLSGMFDEHFAGKPQEMMQWLIAALNHNFGSFLDVTGITASLSGLQAPGMTPESPK